MIRTKIRERERDRERGRERDRDRDRSRDTHYLFCSKMSDGVLAPNFKTSSN